MRKPFCWLTSYEKNKNLAGAFTPVVRFSLFGPDQKKKTIHLVLVRLAFTLAFLTANLKIANLKAQSCIHNLIGRVEWHIFCDGTYRTPQTIGVFDLKRRYADRSVNDNNVPIHWWSAQHCSNLGIIKALFCLRNLTRPTNSTMSQPMMWIWGVAFCLCQ